MNGDQWLIDAIDELEFSDDELLAISKKDSMWNVNQAATQFNAENNNVILDNLDSNKTTLEDSLIEPQIPDIDYSQLKPKRIIPFGYGSREDYPDHNILVSKPERFLYDAFDRRSSKSMFFGEKERQPNVIKSLSKLLFYPRETFEEMGIKGRQEARGEDMSKYGVYARIRPQSPWNVVPPHGKNNPEYYDRVLRQFERAITGIYKGSIYKGKERHIYKPAPMGLQAHDRTRYDQEIVDNKNHNSRYKNYLINQLEYLLEVMPKNKRLDSKRKNIKEVLKENPKQAYLYYNEEDGKTYAFPPGETTEPMQAMGNPHGVMTAVNYNPRTGLSDFERVWENNFYTFVDPDEVDSYNEALDAITEFKETMGKGYDDTAEIFPDNPIME